MQQWHCINNKEFQELDIKDFIEVIYYFQLKEMEGTLKSVLLAFCV